MSNAPAGRDSTGTCAPAPEQEVPVPYRPVTLRVPRGSIAPSALQPGLDALIEKADVPVDFPDEVLDAARAAAEDPAPTEHEDLRDREFLTLDPEGSTDLDQAMHLERTADGYHVSYAIADVPLVVPLGGPVDEEARRRGETIYLPDRRIPLHPVEISEGAGSLLPGQDTPALVWEFDLDAEGNVRSTQLRRAVVCSRRQLDYDTVQEQLDAGTAEPMMQLLMEIGAQRIRLEKERSGMTLNLPEQRVEADGEHLRLQWRRPAPVEDANAQISLLTGMEAARIMIEGGIGILRTMPAPEDEAVDRFRRQARALQVEWPDSVGHAEFLRTLDWTAPRHLALLNQAGPLFRGAGYAAFTAADDVPEDPAQSAIGAPYTHATAPLRRLVDRFVLAVCWRLTQGLPVEDDLREALPYTPEIMQQTGSRAGALEREALEFVEFASLEDFIGEVFVAAVIDRRTPKDAPVRTELQLIEPPVTVWTEIDSPIGEVIRVRLDAVDAAGRTASFTPTTPA
ncbi:MAG: RNB domain-containing ribonuclease [Brachybacterium sp.]|nr:RNB domain-containing ribonuclease [Brachybacterium sp.]